MRSIIPLRVVVILAVGVSLFAGTNAFAQSAVPLAGANAGYTDAELQELVAPIALYPDVLLAQVMASTAFPDQLDAARAWLGQNPDPAARDRINDQPWDLSVKIVAGFDSVLAMLTDNPDWRDSLAWAVSYQQPELMAAVQAMRRMAQDAGNLTSTPQMQVTEDRQMIVIQSADPQVIYVPQFDPTIVYVRRPPTFVSPVILFAPPVRVGWIPSPVFYNRYSFNWWGGGIYMGVWRPGWSVNIGWGSPWRPPIRPQPLRRPTVIRPPVFRPPGGRPSVGRSPVVVARPPGTRPPPSGGGLRPPASGMGGGRPSVSPSRPSGGRPSVLPTPSTPSRPTVRPAPTPAAPPAVGRPSPSPSRPTPAPAAPLPSVRPTPSPSLSRPTPSPAQPVVQRPASSVTSSRPLSSFGPSGGAGSAVRPGNTFDTRAASDRGASSRSGRR
ncbi:MAG: DUF3300 domain-containing protein [Phycisphaerales bacterium]|nr:DUF3300 domain-containing protein [Phycisphaerales bacterium]